MTPPKRQGTNADRDTFSTKTPPKGVALQIAAPMLEIDDEGTDKHEGEQLREIRERRPTPLRVGHLEERVDEVVKTVGEWRAEVSKEIGDVKAHVSSELGKVNAALGSFAGDVRGLATVVEQTLKRDHVTFTAKVEVEKAEKLADTQVKTEQRLDTVEAKKDKRKFWLQIGGALLGGGAVATVGKFVLHWLGVF